MVIFTLLDVSIQTTWWITKNIYYVGRYMIYGKQKTEGEIIEEKVGEKLEKILENEAKLMHDLQIVKAELEFERGEHSHTVLNNHNHSDINHNNDNNIVPKIRHSL